MPDKTFTDMLKKSAKSRHLDTKRIDLFLSVVFPVLYGGLGLISKSLYDFNATFAISCWFVTASLNVLFWLRGHPSNQDVLNLLVANRDQSEAIEETERTIDELRTYSELLDVKNVLSFIFRPMAVEYIRKRPSNTDEFVEMADEILSPIYLNGDSIFGFQVSECWNFALYLCHPHEQKLFPIWRKKSPVHPSKDQGRQLLPGEGHVGKAFIDRMPIITGDANNGDAKQLCRAPANRMRDYDDDVYKAFASIPILVDTGAQAQPFGVLVVTSNIENRFNELNSEVLKHAADTIAMIIELSSIDCSCIINDSRPKKMTSNGETHGQGKPHS